MIQALFYSTIEAVLDAKGRSALPADFRETFGLAESAEVQSRLYLVRWDVAEVPMHLSCFGRSLMDHLVRELDFCDTARAQVIEHILAHTDMMRFDAAGRFAIGPNAITALGLKDKVLYVGVGRFFEIWNPDQAVESTSAKMSSHRAALRQTVKNVQRLTVQFDPRCDS
ncbi:MAG: hypothetical protein HRT36_06820 [Alphaproteobacteria bacterium]|nr:hypothetical protein [Alphaproteobacteria bacterium]